MNRAPTRHILLSTVTVGVATGVSRLTGFAREMLMAQMFGTSLAQSAFVVAFRIPNLFRRLFGEGALAGAFVPVFSASMERDGPDSAWRLAWRVMALLGAVLAVLVGAGMLGATAAIHLGAHGERAALILRLLRIMLPYAWFMCVAALCMAALNALHRFLLPAITPALMNLLWIATLLAVCPRFRGIPETQIHVVAWAVVIGGALQLVVMFPSLVRNGMSLRPVLDWWRDANVRRIVLLMGPAVLGQSVTQVNVLMDALFAIWIGPWAPAALSFAERLFYLPLGTFATALGTVLLPVFSGQAARSRPEEIRATLNQSMRLMLFVMIPAAAGLLVLARPIVEVVFERGAFTSWSTTLTARALAFYAPGLAVFGLYKVFVPAFYALQDTRTPVRVGLYAVALNFALNSLFVITWPPYFKHGGLACATVLAGTFNAAWLGLLLHRRLGSPGWRQIAASGVGTTLASAGLGLGAMLGHSVATLRLASAGPDTLLSRAIALAVGMACGALVFAVFSAILCRGEWGELLGGIARRRGRRRGASGPAA